MLGGPLGEATEAVGGIRRRPAAGAGEPAGRGEVAVGHDRGDPVLEAGADHAPVVVEGGPGEGAGLGLDPGPLEREPVGVEAEVGHRGDVLGVPVVVVTGVEGRLGEQRGLGPLQGPEVGVHVAALDLVPGRGRAPQEPVGEGRHGRQDCPSGRILQTFADRARPRPPPPRRSGRPPHRPITARAHAFVADRQPPRAPGRRCLRRGSTRSATRPPSWSPGTTTCCGCSTARGCRSKPSASPRATVVPRSPTGAAPGAPSPSTTPSSGRRRRSCGSTTRCRRSSASPSRCRRPRPTPPTTTSSRRWATTPSGPGPSTSASASSSWPRPTAPSTPSTPTPRSRRAAGAAGSCPRSGPTTSSTPTARTSRTTSTAWPT